MNDYVKLAIWAAAVAIIFALAWRKGWLGKIADYWRHTMDELRKCTWPTWTELRGSTLVVVFSIVVLGAFTVGVDLIIGTLVRWLIT